MESRRRREALIEEALETFAVYDDLAKRDTLDEMQALLGVEIDEADVEAELRLLESSSLEDADDTEWRPDAVDADPRPDDADPDPDAADAAIWPIHDDDDEAPIIERDSSDWSYLTEDVEADMSLVADDVDASIKADIASEAPPCTPSLLHAEGAPSRTSLPQEGAPSVDAAKKMHVYWATSRPTCAAHSQN